MWYRALQWRHNERGGVSKTGVSIVHSTGYSGANQINYPRSYVTMGSGFRLYASLNFLLMDDVIIFSNTPANTGGETNKTYEPCVS